MSLEYLLTVSKKAFIKLHKTDVNLRAERLNKLADLLNEHRVYLYEIMIQEAGKTLEISIENINEEKCTRCWHRDSSVGKSKSIFTPLSTY